MRTEAVERALLKLHSVGRGAEVPPLPAPEEHRQRWACMSIDDRRTAIGELFECIFVTRGRGQPGQRLSVLRRGEAPPDLPGARRPRRLTQLEPFDPTRHRRSVKLSQPNARPLSERRVREELEVLLEGRERWPTFREFQAAGEALLYRQVQLRGGRASGLGRRSPTGRA